MVISALEDRKEWNKVHDEKTPNETKRILRFRQI
jgi:hypothetical protein